MASLAIFSGCASGNSKSASLTATPELPMPGEPGGYAAKYKTDDGRTIELGRGAPYQGGLSFKNSLHGECWLADDFRFSGYDTLYIAPVSSTATVQPNDLVGVRAVMAAFPSELKSLLAPKRLFGTVTLNEADIKPDSRVLRLESTITEYFKGGGAAHLLSGGLYGEGKPSLQIEGKMTEQGRTVCTFRGPGKVGNVVDETERSKGNPQAGNVHRLSVDLTDFMAAVAGRYEPK
jgi:hypothetical protein